MRKILATIAIAAMSATAFAGGDIKLRGDYTGNASYKNATGVDQAASGGFGSTYARIGYSGKLSDSVTGKVQADFVTGVFVAKYAQVTNKMSDAFALTFGKLATIGNGGFEGATPISELEFKSPAFLMPFPSGMAIDYKISDASALKISFVNQGFGSSASSTVAAPTGATLIPAVTSGAANTATGYGVSYDGNYSFMDVKASYHSVPTAAASKSNNYMALGAQKSFGALKGSLDYLGNTYQAASTDNTKTSIVLALNYDMGQWSPAFRYATTTYKGIAASAAGSDESALTFGTMTDSATYTQMALGVNYKPVAADSFSYHAHYVSLAGTSGTATDSAVTQTKVVAGFTLYTDFAK